VWLFQVQAAGWCLSNALLSDDRALGRLDRQ
jgi:hypothetical protein